MRPRLKRAFLARRIRKLAKTMSQTEICQELTMSDPTLRAIAAEFGINFTVTTVGSNNHIIRRKARQGEVLE